MKEVNALLEEREITTDKPVTEYFSIIKKEKFYQKYPNDFEMVKDWLQGLGGAFFSAEVYLRSARKIISEWLEETEEEGVKYSEENAEDLAVWLFFREMMKLIEKENK